MFSSKYVKDTCTYTICDKSYSSNRTQRQRKRTTTRSRNILFWVSSFPVLVLTNMYEIDTRICSF